MKKSIEERLSRLEEAVRQESCPHDVTSYTIVSPGYFFSIYTLETYYQKYCSDCGKELGLPVNELEYYRLTAQEQVKKAKEYIKRYRELKELYGWEDKSKGGK